jgi:hypothetical protein
MQLPAWDDARRVVKLPAKPLNELGLEVVGYYRGRGNLELTVTSIRKSLAESAILRPGDVFLLVNGNRPKDEKHFVSLFEQSTHRDDYECIVLTPGWSRVGQPLFGVLALALLTACLWFNDPWSKRVVRHDEL